MKYITLFLCVILFSSSSTTQRDVASLEISITGLRSNKGTLYATIFDTADGFPGNAEKAIKKIGKKVHEGSTIVFQDIPYGSYAIAVLHDENDNKKMDTNFIGLPKEGYGASNDAKNTFGPPRFEDAKFTIDQSGKKITIKLTY